LRQKLQNKHRFRKNEAQPQSNHNSPTTILQRRITTQHPRITQITRVESATKPLQLDKEIHPTDESIRRKNSSKRR
jgi:hypothetical protein